MEANYGKTCSTGSKRAGNIATGNEACVVNKLCRSVPSLKDVLERLRSCCGFVI